MKDMIIEIKKTSIRLPDNMFIDTCKFYNAKIHKTISNEFWKIEGKDLDITYILGEAGLPNGVILGRDFRIIDSEYMNKKNKNHYK